MFAFALDLERLWNEELRREFSSVSYAKASLVVVSGKSL